MSILPSLTARALVNILIKAGFVVTRQKGSHLFLKNFLTGKVTSVPMHTGFVKKGTFVKIIKQAGFTLKEFLKFYK
ncbi:MAG: type II toxin-antitoxin system HicA family toxin [Patescibacteria group bacterium]